jgi:hypothetical protein
MDSKMLEAFSIILPKIPGGNWRETCKNTLAAMFKRIAISPLGVPPQNLANKE